jgi:undecaprenyl-diphosphatase
MDSLNHGIFLALNASSEPSAGMLLLAVLAAKYLILLVPLHIALVWLGGTRGDMRLIALASAVALVMALALSQLVGLVFYTPRPFLLGLGRTWMDHRPSSSFPSNHATVFFTYAAVLALFAAWRLAAIVAALGLVVAWSRIYLGVHFPLDMVGAAFVSALSGVAAMHWARRHGGLALRHLQRLAVEAIASAGAR